MATGDKVGGVCGRNLLASMVVNYWTGNVPTGKGVGIFSAWDGKDISVKFGAAGTGTGWPAEDVPNAWGLVSSNGNKMGWANSEDKYDGGWFWKSLGSWNDGANPTYPKLWWE